VYVGHDSVYLIALNMTEQNADVRDWSLKSTY